ncbi:LysR family transcriptional regulator [Verticiella sediminum]|uniref:LysR family transcriptional regulator n=1 Tax=Verticiella sediminum TaxID=1247510 RepID=A0A556ABU8_9BURK|nr:LysR family transcriptional regulator [Verticiella sediminum]TSH90350.1 LysR family transcriptional regulator [Verticiella sediminum]
MIDLRNIETFYWVATLGSFRACAEKLNTTQPAISQRIASLEDSLGVKLFERDARGVRLTGKGHELLSHAERMLQVRQDMLQAAREQNVMSGSLRIGVAETIVQTWLSAFIECVHTMYPALVLEIDVDTSDVMRAQLMSRRIDLAFLMGPVLEPRVENLPLGGYPLAWVASPLLPLPPEPLTLADVAEFPVITYPANSQPYQYVRDMLMRARVPQPRMYGSASLSMVVRMAKDRIGAAVITPVFLDAELAAGDLRVLDVQAEPLPDLSFTATWVQGPDSHAERMLALLAQQTAQRARVSRRVALPRPARRIARKRQT